MDEPAKSAKYAKLAQSSPVCTYAELANLRNQSTVNVFGVVKYFKKPFQTRRSDYCSSLSLVDPSMPSGFKCVLFTKHKDSLPSIHAVGDIVCFRHLSIGKYKGELQGSNRSSEFFWMVFDRQVGMPVVPRVPLGHHCILTEEEKKQVEKLRKWAASKECLNFKLFFRTLNEIKPINQFFNLACQVVAKQFLLKEKCYLLRVWDGTLPVCQTFCVAETDEDSWIVSSELEQRTKGLTVDVCLYENHIEEASTLDVGEFIYLTNVQVIPKLSSPLMVSMKVNKGTMFGRGVSIANDADPTIISTKKRIKVALETPLPVSVKPRPIRYFTQPKAQKNATGEPAGKSDVLLLDHTNSQAKNEMKTKQPDSVTCSGKEPQNHSHLSCTSLEETALPRALQTSCTIASYPLVAFHSIENIKSNPVVPCKFRCRAKCLMYLPKNIKDFVQESCKECKKVFPVTQNTCQPAFGKCPQGITTEENAQSGTVVCAQNSPNELRQNVCPKCLECGGNLKSVYLFSLILEDNTGLLHAKLFDEDALKFLPGLPSPANRFLTNEASQDLVFEKLGFLIGNQENAIVPNGERHLFNRPWVECCLKSYCIPGEDGSGQHHILYRMFDTILSM